MEADEPHLLFTVIPNIDRSVFNLIVSAPYLCGIVREEIAKYDTAHRAWFYQQASDLPEFQGTLDYISENTFLPGDIPNRPIHTMRRKVHKALCRCGRSHTPMTRT